MLKVRGAQRIRLARRMKGIAETNEAGDATVFEELIGAHACNASAHGLAADQQRMPGRQL